MESPGSISDSLLCTVGQRFCSVVLGLDLRAQPWVSALEDLATHTEAQ